MKSNETDIIGKKELKNLAVEILSRLDQISNTASDKIKENRGVSPDSIITDSNQAFDNLKKINAEQFNSLLYLSKEPAIARILVEYDNDEKDIFIKEELDNFMNELDNIELEIKNDE